MGSFKKIKNINSSELAKFSQQLSTLITAGLPLTQSLQVIIKSKSAAAFLVPLLKILYQHLEQGHTLSSVCRQFPTVFDALFCGFLEIGEQTGTLDKSLQRATAYLEKKEALKRKIKGILFYPLIIFFVGCFIFMILLIFVVPSFKNLYANFGAQLPVSTQALLTLSDVILHQGYIVVGVSVVLSFFIKKSYQRNPQFKAKLQTLSLKLPIFKTLHHYSELVYFTRTLGTTLSAGIPLDKALKLLLSAPASLRFIDAIQKLQSNLTQGLPMHQSMRKLVFFPDLVIHMVAIGESSGSLESLLKNLENHYEEALNAIVSRLTVLLEPFLMIFLGLLIGGLVITLYLPIFKMGSLF